MEIRRASVDDVRAVAWLACLLWPHHTLLEMEEEMEGFLNDSDSAIFLAIEDGAAVGFAQAALRHDYVEVLTTLPVAIWKASMLWKQTAAVALQHSCCTPARTGHGNKTASSWPVTAKSPTMPV